MSQQLAIPYYLGIVLATLILVPTSFTAGYQAGTGVDLLLCTAVATVIALVTALALAYGVWRDHRPPKEERKIVVNL